MPLNDLKNYITELLEEFINKYLFFDLNGSQNHIEETKNAFLKLLHDIIILDHEALYIDSSALAKLNIQYELNYVVLINQINYLYQSVSQLLLDDGLDYEQFVALFQSRSIIERTVSKEYLDHYLVRISSVNTIRLNSLNDMLEKRVVSYYEEHLIWLGELIGAIKALDAGKIPELNASICHFGSWLHTEGKQIIKNNSKYTNLVALHERLHHIAALIHKQFHKEHTDYHVLMSYLETCEMISLAIGAELAMIDNTIIIKKAAKDTLTGALNRNALDSIFINQIELAIATNASMVLAMCDLDNFKCINDTYGHIAGDMLLKKFVEIAQKQLRESDIVIRYGGEEFIIILPNTSHDIGTKKLDQIREAFQKTLVVFDGHDIYTTVSIGYIDVLPKEHTDYHSIRIDDFIKRADMNLYQAKKSGKNRIYTLND